MALKHCFLSNKLYNPKTHFKIKYFNPIFISCQQIMDPPLFFAFTNAIVLMVGTEKIDAE